MSLLLWMYEGSNDERKSAEDGRQHTHAGDAFYDDERGPSRPLQMVDGADLCVAAVGLTLVHKGV